MKGESHKGLELEDSSEFNISEQFSQSNGSWIVTKKLGEAHWSWWLPIDNNLQSRLIVQE